MDLSLKGSSPFLIPGTLGAAVMKDMLTLNEEKDDLEPLAYFYGFKEVSGHLRFPPRSLWSLQTCLLRMFAGVGLRKGVTDPLFAL